MCIRDRNTLADARISAADTDDLSEGSSNLYHTTARARAAISATGSLSYNNSTGVISYTAPSLATVATSGDYDDLSNKPTLGTAAATASTAYATAAQGTQATTNDSDIDDIYTELNAIGNDASITTVFLSLIHI